MKLFDNYFLGEFGFYAKINLIQFGLEFDRLFCFIFILLFIINQNELKLN